MKETNSCFLRMASKALVRIQQNLYTAFELIWQSNLQNFLFSRRQVLHQKMKIKVSSVKISSKMKGRKYDEFNYDKIHIYIYNYRFHKHFTTWNQLVCFERWQSQLAASASHTIIIEIIIIKIPSRCMTVYLTRGFFYQHGQS